MRRAWRGLRLALTTSFRADPWRTVGVVICSVLSSGAGVLGAYWLKEIVDAAVLRDEDGARAAALFLGLTVGFGVLARTCVTAMLFPLKESTGAYLDRHLIELVAGTATVEHHERPAYLDQVDVLRHEAFMLASAGLSTAAALGLAVQMMLTGALLASVNPLLLVVPLFAVPSFWAGTRAERVRQDALDASADPTREGRHLFDLATATTAGKEVRVFGLQEELLRRHEATWRNANQRLDAAALRGLGWSAAGWVLFTIGYAGAITLTAAQAVDGRASVGEVVLALALVAQVNAQVGSAIHTVSDLARLARVAGRYDWLIEYAAARRFAAPEPAAAPARLDQGIELRGVGFRYPGTDDEVLGGVDLSIPAGAVVALVGDNGAGKSTLVKLLCRFYEPSAGVILVDGTELSRIDPAEWRARMSAGFQDFVHLELLARQSVGVGDLPRVDDDAAVHAALDRAASAEVLGALPAGLDTQLGSSFDEGVELSGGQWQKLALARAMMRSDPLLLVLDEPTAALDADTEHALFARYTAAAAVLARRTGAITLLVSHRFSTVRMAELIVVVDGGRIAEVGSHDELMTNRGLYAELYELQARAYR